ncbi:hypothetical protein EDB89DRAFT_1914258 [Lactarius sanguifluus]|nr:hypothetical protein EDB89DRAFT_1914258 [Lactarius sanguifluus]
MVHQYSDNIKDLALSMSFKLQGLCDSDIRELAGISVQLLKRLCQTHCEMGVVPPLPPIDNGRGLMLALMLASIMPTAAPLHCRHGHPTFVDIAAVGLLLCWGATAVVFGGRRGQPCVGRAPVVVGSLSRSALGAISKVFCFAVATPSLLSLSSVVVCSARGCIGGGVAATAAIVLVYISERLVGSYGTRRWQVIGVQANPVQASCVDRLGWSRFISKNTVLITTAVSYYWCRGGFVRGGPAWRWSGRGWRMRGQAVLLATGVVRSCCVGVTTGLVGVVLGLVGVASGLVGVAPGLVGVVPGLVCCTGDFGVAWAGVAGVAIVGPGSRRGICNVGVTVRRDGEMAWLGWR